MNNVFQFFLDACDAFDYYRTPHKYTYIFECNKTFLPVQKGFFTLKKYDFVNDNIDREIVMTTS